MFASCVLFSPDCHASLWSSWPAQLGWCVSGLSHPGPSSSSSSFHHISRERCKSRPAACISARRRLLPALPTSSAVQPATKKTSSDRLFKSHPVINRPCRWNGAVLVESPLRDCSVHNSDPARRERVTASSCSWTSSAWRCGSMMMVSADLDSGWWSGFSLGEWQSCVTLFYLIRACY